MRTRNAGKPKSEPVVKRTNPTRRSDGKNKTPPESDVTSSENVELANPSADVMEVTPPVPKTRGRPRKTPATTPATTKTPTSARSARRTPKTDVREKVSVEASSEKDAGMDYREEESVLKEKTLENLAEETTKKAENEKNEVGDPKVGESSKKEEASEATVQQSTINVEPVIENFEKTDKEGTEIVLNVEAPSKVEEKSSYVEPPPVLDVGMSSEKVEDPLVTQGDEIPVDSNKVLEEEPDVDNETIDQQEEKTTDIKHSLDQSVTNPGEPSKTEEDTINTKQLLDQSVMCVEEPLKLEEKTLDKETLNQSVTNPEEPPTITKGSIENESDLISHDEEATSQKEENQELGIRKEIEEVKNETDVEMKTLEEKLEVNHESVNVEDDPMDEDVNQVAKEKGVAVGDKNVIEDALEVERAELNAAAKQRMLRKELEIFVGGLDPDATEEDVKKAFENVGEIVEVRLHKDSSSSKNKGYAFVKFATKELATQALSDVKNPLIRGKKCRTAPSADNDMLFLGNICNTWTKETIKQKLKDYGIDSVENINVIQDTRHEGLSRGFAFLEFSCHVDAMQAYTRLQKPDAIFGHTERTVKVAFAEPVREPDPEVMAQVKSVFVDGLPPQWTEEKVREKLKGCGEIVRITLARNMSSAKRKDFGFVDFTTHEDAVACIEAINSKDFGEGNSKGRVRARLSNPTPKTQVVKGGMCGGFKIGRGGGSTSSSSRPGKGLAVGGHAINRPNLQRDRSFYPRGRGQSGRGGFTREHDIHMQYPPPQTREMFGRGGWREHFGAAPDTFPGGPIPLRPQFDMSRHVAAGNRGHGRHAPNSRLPFPTEEVYNGPVMGRQMNDPYFYDGSVHGTKRPFSATEQEPNYMERSRLRPRMDYSGPAVPYQAPSYRGTFGPERSHPSHNYYGPDYRGGPRPDFYGNIRPYGGGYPPRY